MVTFEGKLNCGVYGPGEGHFGIFWPRSKEMAWFHCREQFHSVIDMWRPDWYITCLKEGHESRVAATVDEVESLLGVRSCAIEQTNHANLFAVRAGQFWFADPMRHSFLTVLLRAACNRIDGEGLRQCMERNDYFAVTRPAVDRFLKGYTRYAGNVIGWKEAFKDHSNVRLLTDEAAYANRREEEVGKLAMELWDRAGRPAGRDQDNWFQACRLYDAA